MSCVTLLLSQCPALYHSELVGDFCFEAAMGNAKHCMATFSNCHQCISFGKEVREIVAMS